MIVGGKKNRVGEQRKSGGGQNASGEGLDARGEAVGNGNEGDVDRRWGSRDDRRGGGGGNNCGEIQREEDRSVFKLMNT